MFTDPNSLFYKSWLGTSRSETSAAIAGVIDGGPLTDRLSGTAAVDTMFGRAGDDTLLAGVGNDVLNGGAGTDSISYAGPEIGAVQVTCLRARLVAVTALTWSRPCRWCRTRSAVM